MNFLPLDRLLVVFLQQSGNKSEIGWGADSEKVFCVKKREVFCHSQGIHTPKL